MEKHGMERDTVVNESKLLKRVKEAVLELAPKAEVILYGSRARGTAHRDSDWDFLILLPGLVSKELEMEIKDRLYDIELETDTVLTSIVRSKQVWLSKRYEVLPLRQEVEKDGIVV
ncbi:MAG: nucleotidyltransferase domain-containing protein [Chloroflexi bacterium]|nr:nucleotidyltransferase domain-containing protein [Chloroflexota bacterium]